MGLDQYLYVAAKPTAKRHSRRQPKANPREIAYRRKHANLHGWMERLWTSKGKPNQVLPNEMFNGIELELTREDIDALEQDILNKTLPQTTGFFFGQGNDSRYYEEDLKFIIQARAELFMKLRVFYTSSW